MSVPLVVLLVSPPERHRDAHELGKRLAQQLAASARHDIRHLACDSPQALLNQAVRNWPVAILFNWHPDTMPWVTATAAACRNIPTLAIVRDVTGAVADAMTDLPFDVLVATDPELVTRNPRF